MDSIELASSASRDQVLENLFEEQLESSGKKFVTKEKPIYKSLLESIPLVGRFVKTDPKQEMIDQLLEEQKFATTYAQWYDISLQLDELLGNNEWKNKEESKCYDYRLIRGVMMEMREAREKKDYKLLLYLIRTKWTRNIGNMGDINLYRHSHVGTKKLVEEYIRECQISLDCLVAQGDALDDRYLLGMLIQTRKNIGRTALVLSGGSTFGIFHIGVLATLIQANILPRIVSGSSAGSIMASILCCNTNNEIIELLAGIKSRKFNIFGESDPKKNNFKSLLDRLAHFLKYGTFFDVNGLKETMLDFIGDLTFREAYNRTGKILNITVSPESMHESTRLLNYLTAPNCLVWSAVCASCSLPGFFPSTSIYERTPSTGEVHEWNNDSSAKYLDGSVDNDLPITRLSEMFNVDHIIAVQVNPHVAPILRVSVSNIGGEVETNVNHKFKVLMNNVYDFMSSEIVHYLQLCNEMNIQKILSHKLIAILSQNYSGDITICADFKAVDFLKLFENPTPDFLLDFIVRGARASWPKITVIKNHCEVEFALDKAITLLRGRIILSSADKRIKRSALKKERRIRMHPPRISRNNSDKKVSRNGTPKKDIARGKSTTALWQMTAEQPIKMERKGKVRRARSSGNFYPHSSQLVLSPQKMVEANSAGTGRSINDSNISDFSNNLLAAASTSTLQRIPLNRGSSHYDLRRNNSQHSLRREKSYSSHTRQNSLDLHRHISHYDYDYFNGLDKANTHSHYDEYVCADLPQSSSQTSLTIKPQANLPSSSKVRTDSYMALNRLKDSRLDDEEIKACVYNTSDNDLMDYNVKKEPNPKRNSVQFESDSNANDDEDYEDDLEEEDEEDIPRPYVMQHDDNKENEYTEKDNEEETEEVTEERKEETEEEDEKQSSEEPEETEAAEKQASQVEEEETARKGNDVAEFHPERYLDSFNDSFDVISSEKRFSLMSGELTDKGISIISDDKSSDEFTRVNSGDPQGDQP